MFEFANLYDLTLTVPFLRCKQEVHYLSYVGKRADLAMFGVSDESAVRALELTTFWLHYRKKKRQAQTQEIK